ncbi:MAG: PEP-CTERM sorting domain-containing protein [Bryobacteraceae bacterium]|nr:PEP-CTERM sorting domain-containing protein [Bryobacteraceae bacterium]
MRSLHLLAATAAFSALALLGQPAPSPVDPAHPDVPLADPIDIPEPATYFMIGTGLVIVGFIRRRAK